MWTAVQRHGVMAVQQRVLHSRKRPQGRRVVTRGSALVRLIRQRIGASRGAASLAPRRVRVSCGRMRALCAVKTALQSIRIALRMPLSTRLQASVRLPMAPRWYVATPHADPRHHDRGFRASE